MHYESYDEYDAYTHLPGMKQRVMREVRATGKQSTRSKDEPSEWLTSQV